MALRLRQFDEILADMISHVAANTNLTDFNPGSVIRTVLESSALEDEEQYLQIAELLKLFSINNAKAQNLIRRGQDFGVNGRLPAAPAAAQVTIRDDSLTQDEVALNMAVGVDEVTVVTPSVFGDLAPTFTIRIGEGTPRVEDLEVASVDLISATGHLKFTTETVNDHFAGERVAVVSGDADIVVSAGTLVRRPATSTTGSIDYVTQDAAIIANGNYESNEVNSIAVTPGSSSRVGAAQITSFTDGSPFIGASVTNTTSSGGADVETDAQLRDRIIKSQQIKTAATASSIEANLAGLLNSTTGQRISTVKVREDFENDVVTVFIDDGTGLSPDSVSFGSTALSADVSSGDATIPVVSAAAFPNVGYVMINEQSIFRYNGTAGNVIFIDTDEHSNGIDQAFTQNDSVKQVELADIQTETGQVDFFSKLFPIQDGSMEVYTATLDDVGTFGWLGANEVTGFILNRGSGQVQLTTPVIGGLTAFLHYTYYEGILNSAQVVLNGDPNDLLNLPGVRAQGIRTVVDVPTVVNVTVRASITAQIGFNELDLRPQVQSAIADYINGLSVGEDVIVSEIIAVSQEVDGVLDTLVSNPSANIIVAEDELARIDLGDVLVT